MFKCTSGVKITTDGELNYDNDLKIVHPTSIQANKLHLEHGTTIELLGHDLRFDRDWHGTEIKTENNNTLTLVGDGMKIEYDMSQNHVY